MKVLTLLRIGHHGGVFSSDVLSSSDQGYLSQLYSNVIDLPNPT